MPEKPTAIHPHTAPEIPNLRGANTGDYSLEIIDGEEKEIVTPEQIGTSPTLERISEETPVDEIRVDYTQEIRETLAEEAEQFFDESPLFNGLSPEAKAAILPRLQQVPDQSEGRVLFDPNDADGSLARTNGIIIPAQETHIQVSKPNGEVITNSEQIPANTPMGSKGFLNKDSSRTVQIKSLTPEANFWRLEGPLDELNLEKIDQLNLRANLLAARAELQAINQEIGSSRVNLEGFAPLAETMPDILQALGRATHNGHTGEIKAIPGEMFYLKEGTLKIVTDNGIMLGMIKGPQLVQESIGAGREGSTKLMVHGIVKGAHLPVAKLLTKENPDLVLAEHMLELAESSFELKIKAGNEAVHEGRQAQLSAFGKKLEDLKRWWTKRPQQS